MIYSNSARVIVSICFLDSDCPGLAMLWLVIFVCERAVSGQSFTFTDNRGSWVIDYESQER